jgi:hypothetical protein
MRGTSVSLICKLNVKILPLITNIFYKIIYNEEYETLNFDHSGWLGIGEKG